MSAARNIKLPPHNLIGRCTVSPDAQRVSISVRKIVLSAAKLTLQRSWSLILTALRAVALGHVTWAQTDANAASDQKVKKVFYSSKDRLNAMHNATLFTPRAVADAAILE